MEWKTVKLGEVCSILGDGIHGTPVYDIKGTYFFVNGNNLDNGRIVFKEDTKKVDKSEFVKHKKDLTDRTILISINGTLGNTAKYNGEPCILGKSACYFNVLPEYDRDFIYYLVTNSKFKGDLERMATGTTIKNVSLKLLREYELSIPPIETQRRIAAILSSLDDKIENNNRINRNLEAQAQALFKSWFVDFEPWGGTMPEDWKEGTLESITDKIASGGTPKSMNKQFYIGNIKWFSTKELTDSFLIDSEKHISEDAYKNSATKMFPAGTVLMAIYAAPTVGRLGILLNEATFNQAAVGLIAKREIGKEYLYFLLKSERTKLNNLASGAAQQNLNVGIVKNYPIIVPHRSVSMDFQNIVKPLFDQIANNQQESHRLAAFRDTLLPKLMKGEIEI